MDINLMRRQVVENRSLKPNAPPNKSLQPTARLRASQEALFHHVESCTLAAAEVRR